MPILLKVERFHGQQFSVRREAKDETLAGLPQDNRWRLHSALAYITPMQFEQNWLAVQDRQAPF